MPSEERKLAEFVPPRQIVFCEDSECKHNLADELGRYVCGRETGDIHMRADETTDVYVYCTSRQPREKVR